MASFKDMFDNVKDKISSRATRNDEYDYNSDDEFDDYSDPQINDAIKPITAFDDEPMTTKRSSSRSANGGLDSLFSSTEASAAETAVIDLAGATKREERRVSVGRANTHSGPIAMPELTAKKEPVIEKPKARQVAVIKPDNYEEAQDLVGVLKAGDACILDMRGTNANLANRFMDFSFGVTAALSGKVDIIMNKVYGITVGKALTQAEIDKVRAEGLI